MHTRGSAALALIVVLLLAAGACGPAHGAEDAPAAFGDRDDEDEPAAAAEPGATIREPGAWLATLSDELQDRLDELDITTHLDIGAEPRCTAACCLRRTDLGRTLSLSLCVRAQSSRWSRCWSSAWSGS